MAHKDLSEVTRRHFQESAASWAASFYHAGESLALAREAWINAFDKAAEELEATDAE